MQLRELAFEGLGPREEPGDQSDPGHERRGRDPARASGEREPRETRRAAALLRGVDPGLDASVASLDELLRQLVTFSEALNNSEGSLGQFVHNRELYDSLNDAATRIEQATRMIKPIMQNVRTLTDKIARDPRQLGIKGALDRKPLGAGLNTAPSSTLPNYRARDPFPR